MLSVKRFEPNYILRVLHELRFFIYDKYNPLTMPWNEKTVVPKMEYKLYIKISLDVLQLKPNGYVL